jgi:medium-chain acyl-[acyl-carrier-protein] hydrolase
LFCFPYAGAGASVFRGWGEAFRDDTEVWAVQPPGRETRIKEPPHSRVENLIREFMPTVRCVMDRPYALFGHSLGAVTAYELSRQMFARDRPRPVHLFVSGAVAPHRPKARHLDGEMPDEDLRRQLEALGGTTPEVLENDRLMELVLPALRADFAAARNYSCTADPAIDVPITVFAGIEDEVTDSIGLDAWAELTTAECRRFDLPGGHLFLRDSRDRLLDIIARTLEVAR